jgi:hypothetical protein
MRDAVPAAAPKIEFRYGKSLGSHLKRAGSARQFGLLLVDKPDPSFANRRRLRVEGFSRVKRKGGQPVGSAGYPQRARCGEG